uniref:(California timema) hypothetical protein n=1 Tax=Timema californicum TaxID=61474 RepID=A0A7R9J8J4_TIMCA|nr:unnamed protein product [Timema californicum]
MLCQVGTAMLSHSATEMHIILCPKASCRQVDGSTRSDICTKPQLCLQESLVTSDVPVLVSKSPLHCGLSLVTSDVPVLVSKISKSPLHCGLCLVTSDVPVLVSKSLLHRDLSQYSVPLLQVLGRRNTLHAHNYCTGSNKVPTEKLSLLQRFKQMYRDYWYVLVPVHVITSIGWFGAFFYMLQSSTAEDGEIEVRISVGGVDVIAILENLNVSEKVINPLRDSKAGYLAISYALYKIATPLRYTVTLGGTTVSINYLKKWGYIKPIPARDKLKEMYQERKDNLLEKKDTLMKETSEELKYRREQLKERTDNLMKTYRDKSKN